MTLARAVVIGGGYTGTLQALQLLRHTDASVTLVERSCRLARGIAYGTARPEHLLNVRAAGMSAFPDAPAHFADWLVKRGAGDAASFAPRRLYGTYLEELLAGAGDRLTVIEDEAVAVEHQAVRLRSGSTIEAEAVVLAVGNLAPGTLAPFSGEGFAALYQGDPWESDIADGLGAADAVLLVGTGLTAIDAALTLDAAGFRGRILALSRRGLLPRAHAEPAPPPPLEGALPRSLSALTRAVRRSSREIGWRAAVDRLRPVTQSLWASASVDQRRRFLRHLRPWWDVHRHRIAPEIASRIEKMQADGRIEAAAGRIVSARAEGGEAVIRWRPRGEEGVRALPVRRIVNCTGPQSNIARAAEPLLDALLAAGRIRPDPCGIGIDVDERLRVLGADGSPTPGLHAVGPMTRGALWEIVAVPDIRVQVQALARDLASSRR